MLATEKLFHNPFKPQEMSSCFILNTVSYGLLSRLNFRVKTFEDAVIQILCPPPAPRRSCLSGSRAAVTVRLERSSSGHRKGCGTSHRVHTSKHTQRPPKTVLGPTPLWKRGTSATARAGSAEGAFIKAAPIFTGPTTFQDVTDPEFLTKSR